MSSVAPFRKPPVGELGKLQLLELYHYLKLNRMVEEKLTNLYRQGKVVGGLYRSLGQEACSVGAAYALARGDVMTPLIRNLGAIFVRGGRARDVLCQYMARAAGPTGGRDLNTHFGWLREDGSNIAVISMLGDMVPSWPAPPSRSACRAAARSRSPGSATGAPPPAPSTRA